MEKDRVEEPDVGEVPSRAHAYAKWQPTDVERGLSLLGNAMTTTVVLGAVFIGRGLSPAVIGLVMAAVAGGRLASAARTTELRRRWWRASITIALAAVIPPFALILPSRPVAVVAAIATTAGTGLLVIALTSQADQFGGETAAIWRRAGHDSLRRIVVAGVASTLMVLVAPPASDDGSSIRFYSIEFGSSWFAGACFAAAIGAAIWAYTAIRYPWRVLRANAEFERKHADATSG